MRPPTIVDKREQRATEDFNHLSGSQAAQITGVGTPRIAPLTTHRHGLESGTRWQPVENPAIRFPPGQRRGILGAINLFQSVLGGGADPPGEHGGAVHRR